MVSVQHGPVKTNVSGHQGTKICTCLKCVSAHVTCAKSVHSNGENVHPMHKIIHKNAHPGHKNNAQKCAFNA